MKGKIIPEFAGELPDSVESNFRRIIEIVEDDGLETAEQELENGVGANITGTTGDHNSLRRHE